MDKPRIRPVEAVPIEQEGQTYVMLRDPAGIAPAPIAIGTGAYFLVTLFDGANTLLDLQAAFTRRFGDLLPSEHLNSLIEALDQGYFLDSPRYADRVREIHEEFARAPQRPAALAGLAYENDPTRLRAEIASYFQRPGAPGEIPPPRADGAALSGLISPHIDPRRGGAAYAHAYGELLTRERPELVIILGTSHYGMGAQLFTATRKDYATPLGAVATDRAFVDRLAARYTQGGLFAQEILHRNEHSIEFQALFLAWALGTAGYKIVPILVGSFHEMVGAGESPALDERVRGFIDALRAELAAEARRVLIIAGVDFAHVGRKFGDQFKADDKIAEWVKSADLALIENIKRGDPDGFFADVAKDRDARKICGLSPMYTQLELLRGHQARLLMHDIAMEPQTESAVSFASLAID
ncbi:MAG TPA: AmmeMemoRadiSam system protein B [Candidatus Binataceae bacterium]|nr:AmmeMemoRadiSam system protein B [Candidatus Binataceae bacterium]